MKIDVAMMFLFSLENISCEMIISFMDKRHSKHDSQTNRLPLPKLKQKAKIKKAGLKIEKNNFGIEYILACSRCV